jgi:pimeloyl-ACP methyl ester carboxylesterase
MELLFQSYGTSGNPLIILHGLLGSSDNWHTLAKTFGKQFRVFTLDARNHGRSPHSEVFTYEAMADDVREFLAQHHFPSAHLLGHSMGGKTAMHVALIHPQLVDRLIVVDIAPRAYTRQHDYIFDAVSSLDLSTFPNRNEINEALKKKIASEATRQFVMKNLAREESGAFRWKMNLDVIRKQYDGINTALDSTKRFDKPALFIKSNKSGYVRADDEKQVHQMFPKARIVGLDVGHWIHAEAPEEFARIILEFLE